MPITVDTFQHVAFMFCHYFSVTFEVGNDGTGREREKGTWGGYFIVAYEDVTWYEYQRFRSVWAGDAACGVQHTLTGGPCGVYAWLSISLAEFKLVNVHCSLLCFRLLGLCIIQCVYLFPQMNPPYQTVTERVCCLTCVTFCPFKWGWSQWGGSAVLTLSRAEQPWLVFQKLLA